MYGRHSAAVALVSRGLLATIFLYSGVMKIFDPVMAAATIAAAGLPWPLVGALSAGALEVLGGMLLVLGLFSRPVALALAVYLVPVTLFFHLGDSILQMKNLAIMGGLLMLSAYGPGSFSIDERLRRKHVAHESDRLLAHAMS